MLGIAFHIHGWKRKPLWRLLLLWWRHKCGPYRRHTKSIYGIFQVHELDNDFKINSVQLKGKFIVIDFAQESIFYTVIKSLICPGGKKVPWKMLCLNEKILVTNKLTRVFALFLRQNIFRGTFLLPSTNETFYHCRILSVEQSLCNYKLFLQLYWVDNFKIIFKFMNIKNTTNWFSMSSIRTTFVSSFKQQ